MQKKSYKLSENQPITANESALAYQTKVVETSFSDKWNPNIPFCGTQEEWWEHFKSIEKEQFYPVTETHKRILQWFDNQKR